MSAPCIQTGSRYECHILFDGSRYKCIVFRWDQVWVKRCFDHSFALMVKFLKFTKWPWKNWPFDNEPIEIKEILNVYKILTDMWAASRLWEESQFRYPGCLEFEMILLLTSKIWVEYEIFWQFESDLFLLVFWLMIFLNLKAFKNWRCNRVESPIKMSTSMINFRQISHRQITSGHLQV